MREYILALLSTIDIFRQKTIVLVALFYVLAKNALWMYYLTQVVEYTNISWFVSRSCEISAP